MKSLNVMLAILSLFSGMLVAQEKTVIKNVEVTANELTARAGAAKEYRSLGKFKRDEVLPVYSTAGDWYETKCPGDLKVYVFQKYITVTGNDGVITGDNVNGRADASEDAQVLFKFPIKTKVNVLGLTNGWVLIAPPPQATSWIAKQYTKDTDANAIITVEDNSKENSKPIVENDEVNEKPAPKTTTEKTKKPIANNKSKEVKSTGEVPPAVKEILEDRERKNNEIKENLVKTQNEILNGETEASYLKTGWVRRLGRVIGRKATHALYISEGSDLCHLISNDDSIKLEDFAGKYVGIKGEENGKEKRSDVGLITVTKIVVLEHGGNKIKLNDNTSNAGESKSAVKEVNKESSAGEEK